MTLSDAYELQEMLKQCGDAAQISSLLDEYGEDSDTTVSEMILSALAAGKRFELKDEKAFLHGSMISCPDCGNSSPEKILSSIAGILSGSGEIHFGCCECGTQFSCK